jgi:DNA-binding LacI/PurR family transcriptional regulator
MKSHQRPETITMADVAARAGVSRALVSIVFRGVPGASPATRQRVLEAAEELAYRPDQRARLLGSNRSRMIGVVFGLHREFHGEIVDGLYRAVDGTGYDIGLGAASRSRSEQQAVQSLLDYRSEGLILVGSTLSRASLDELAEQVPVIVVARAIRSRLVDVVRTDDVTGARLAVEHLAGLGHEAIVHVDGQRAPGAAERRRGYREAMSELDLSRHARVVPGGLTEEHGQRAAAALCDGAAPTAVTAFNDHCAAGFMAAVRSRGARVPEEVSIVGYDDSHIAGLAGIALTTVAQDSPTMAKSALDLALNRLQGGNRDAAEVVIKPRLVVRGTSQARVAASASDYDGRPHEV